MLNYIWGVKTQALFDVWSLEHILSGISIGFIIYQINRFFLDKEDGVVDEKTLLFFDIIGVLFVAFIWETLEHYLEMGLVGGTVSYWFQGVEFWANRLITDPLMLVLGYFIAKKYSSSIKIARAGSTLWMAVHIFLFPHSMYLHEIFI